MKQPLAAAAAALLLLESTSALAGGFLTATPTYSDLNVGGVSNPVGVAISGGYEFEAVPLFLEVESYYSGKFGLRGDKQFSTSGAAVYAGFAIPLSDSARLLLKGGRYSYEDDSEDFGSVRYRDYIYGGGLEVVFLQDQFGLRAEVENAVYDGAPDTQIYKLGLVWRPPSGSRKFEPNPYTAPVSASSATSAPPPAAAAPAMAVVFKPGDQALARPGAPLRATPREDAEVVQTLLPSPVLKLESSIVNATGTWWFVSSDIERGWLRADELVSMR